MFNAINNFYKRPILPWVIGGGLLAGSVGLFYLAGLYQNNACGFTGMAFCSSSLIILIPKAILEVTRCCNPNAQQPRGKVENEKEDEAL